MHAAYVDTSVVLADAFGESSVDTRARQFGEFSAVFSSRFLEAEFRSAFRRVSAPPNLDVLDPIKWVDTGRSLAPEIDRVLAIGYIRGADCWHLATALFVSPTPSDLTFLTLDIRQRTVAKKLGFRV